MAKKNKQTKKVKTDIDINVLPQNILLRGERVEENKNIYIHQNVYNSIHKFSENKTEYECGGILVGTTIEEFGKLNIIIYGFIEAKFSEGTATTLKFTHETWEYVHSEINKKYKDMKIVGWIHTHPNFGIFLSEYDKFIQENFFRDENQVAYVVDPIQKIEGFYFWINDKIEKCKGFYVFDKTGVPIECIEDKNEIEETKQSKKTVLINNLIFVILCVIMLIFACLLTNVSNKYKTANEQQIILESEVNDLKRQVSLMSAQISILQHATATDATEESEIIIEEESSSVIAEEEVGTEQETTYAEETSTTTQYVVTQAQPTVSENTESATEGIG